MHVRFFHFEDRYTHVFIYQLFQPDLGLLLVLELGLGGVGGHHALDPRVQHPFPLLGLRNVQNTSSGSSGGGRKLQVTNLEDELHVREQANALVRWQGQQTVVVHGRVHGLDPVRVKVSVKHDPLRVLVRHVCKLTHVERHQTVLPLTSRQVHISVELLGGDRLRVDITNGHLLLVHHTEVIIHNISVHTLLNHLREHTVCLCTAHTSGSHQKHAVANGEQVSHLGHTQHKVVIPIKPSRLAHLANHILHLLITLTRRISPGEQIIQQTHEDNHVGNQNLRDVKVTQSTEQHVRLHLSSLRAKQRPSHHKHRLDRSQPPVVVLLWRKHILQQIVQRSELLRQHLRLDETLRHEHILHNQLTIGNHHSNGAEESLQRLGELCTANVTRVHGNETRGTLLKGHLNTVRSNELVVLDPLVEHTLFVDIVQTATRHVGLTLLCVRHTLVLDRAHRQHLGHKAVELVEASPGSRRSKTLEDISHRTIVHLRSTVEHVH
mmetsp:Transcript_30311/g.36797  ORF Transcript_30311/g.36797 Transcript_30311/m.36797 type:complete len:493 (-) Transcript_30311:2152-3630(-)